MSRDELIQLLQKHVLPFSSFSEIEVRLTAAEAKGFEPHGRTAGRPCYEPVQALDTLLASFPEFFEDRELRIIERDSEVLAGILVGRTQKPSKYWVRQTVQLEPQHLPSTGVACLWIPVPRDIPRAQAVLAARFDPPELEKYYIPSAGILYRVPLLRDPFGASAPLLEMEFELEQSLPELVNLRDSQLIPLDWEGDNRVKAWLEINGIASALPARTRIERLLAAMAESFHPTVWGPFSIAALLRLGLGNLETLSLFLAEALRILGFGVRIGAGQPLMLSGDCTMLRYPNSFAYPHRFVHWAEPDATEAGTIDLSYMTRWGALATSENTSSDALRSRLQAIGSDFQRILQNALYATDVVIGGLPAPSYFRNLESYLSYDDVVPLGPGVHTTIEAAKSGGVT